MNTPGPLANPTVAVTLHENGEVTVELRAATGEAHHYLYDNPELLHGVAIAFRRGAVDSQLIQTGTASFAELAPHWGGIEIDANEALTHADFERFLAEQETHDDD